MKNHLRYSLILLGIAFMLAACISTSSEPEIVATRIAEAPPTAAPPASLPEQFDLAAGAALFASSCAPCHGESGLGDGPAASGFSCEMPALALAPPEIDLREWVDIATSGRRTSETCIMPPWNQRLGSDEIWNAVIYTASLRHDSSLLDQGESLLAAYQTNNSVDFLADSAWQVDNTDADILAAMSANRLDGFDIAEPPSDEDQQAMLVYIRAQAYADVSAIAQESTPVPQSTEEALPAATEEQITPTAVPPTLEPVTLTGTVVNGTAGASVPDDLMLTLRVAGLDASGVPFEMYNQSTEITDGGRFTFENVPPESRALAVIGTTYDGVRQLGPETTPSLFAEDGYEMTFTIYETTNDSSSIVLTRSETWIDAVTAEGASLILQSYDFTNTGDRIYIGDDLGRTLTIPLPDATLNSAIDAIPNPPGRFILERDGDSATYYDTQPVYPGAAGRIATSFDLRYEGTMQIVQGFAYPMLDATVFVSEVRGLQLESDQLEEAGTGSLNDLTYRGFALSAEELPPGSDLTYRVFDGQPPAAAAPGVPSAGGDESTWSLSNNAGLILGLGVLLIIGGGMFLFYDLQRRRMELESESLPPTIVDEEDLIAAMAALDEAYEAGNIGEEAYQNRRQALKDALRDRMR